MGGKKFSEFAAGGMWAINAKYWVSFENEDRKNSEDDGDGIKGWCVRREEGINGGFAEAWKEKKQWHAQR